MMILYNSLNLIDKKNEYSNLYKFRSYARCKHIIQMICYIILLVIIICLIYKNKNLKIYSKQVENRLSNANKNFKKFKKKIKDKYKKDNLLQLYIENRTEFYIKGRQKVMKGIGSIYNDSNILTFQDKLNWLLVHDSPELKTNIVDKILLREYSKKILGKDICVPIIKIIK